MGFSRIFIENKPRSSLTHHCLLSAAYKSAISKGQDAQGLQLTTHAIKSQNNLSGALRCAAIPHNAKEALWKLTDCNLLSLLSPLTLRINHLCQALAIKQFYFKPAQQLSNPEHSLLLSCWCGAVLELAELPSSGDVLGPPRGQEDC